MSRAIAAARPSIASAAAADQQLTPQSRKPRPPKTDRRSTSIKALPRPKPASMIDPLGRLVSSRLSRQSHPDCRAIQAFTNDSLTMLYEAIRGALAADDALKR